MEYKYYLQTPNGYQLKKDYKRIYIITIILLLVSFVLIIGGSKTSGKSFYLFPAITIIIAVLLPIFRNAYKVFISSQSRTVTVKTLRGTKTYPFSEFLNFHITRQRVNGITTNYQVSMFFNENERNRNILLGVVHSQKKADRLIEETKSLLR